MNLDPGQVTLICWGLGLVCLVLGLKWAVGTEQQDDSASALREEP